MLRLRRYRVFVACAVVFIFLLYRVSVNSAWDDSIQSQYRYVASAVLPNAASRPLPVELDQRPIGVPTYGDEEDGDREPVKIPVLKPSPDAGDFYVQPDAASAPAPALETAADDEAPAPTPPPVGQVPDRMPATVEDVPHIAAQEPLLVQEPPARLEPSTTFDPPIHWTKLPEHFPVPEDSIIALPTGKPKSIPTIQHKFGRETTESLERRKRRLAEVKLEMQRAWDTYSKHAFGHDELVPLQRTFRDPFGGWGATLVDSMDTLYIMGMKQEFNHAYRGLSKIDFTTCDRNDIPVFETTIRYLGGLIAAYDVTGGSKGEYPMLLTKAVELAEILIGVFDTPNRMPMLYYNWKPAYVSQPHRANTRAGIAEMGTLSMEFTRLAQLTGEDKYYDAVARITDALDEWQNRKDDTASMIPGIFPENVDASGCNKSATALLLEDTPSSRAREQANDGPLDRPMGYVAKKPSSSSVDASDDVGGISTTSKRDIEAQTPPQVSDSSRWGSNTGTSSQEPLKANGLPAGFACVPQNLTAAAGAQSFGMGGSQDSAYEYFPKQYLLLGGLEPKYRSLHENTVEAVKKHLLYRPLAENDPDILFSSKLRVNPGSDIESSQGTSREYEVTHLTCFLGGMFAMGGKIFESEEDLDIGRRLTDGCVWAYSSMPAGIMAEYAQVVPCQNMESCSWNETQWHLAVDPDPQMRDSQVEAYYGRLADWEAKKHKLLRAEAERLQAEEEFGQPFSGVDDPLPPNTIPGQGKSIAMVGASHSRGDASRRDDEVQAHTTKWKRTLDPETGDTLAFDPSTLDQDAIEEKLRMLEEEFEHPTPPSLDTTIPAPDGSYGGLPGQIPINPHDAQRPRIKPALAAKISIKPHQPPSSSEYVKQRIESEGLPPGYSRIGSGGYQLRPEAIESVWYMYRITGDPTWQDKGWKMWKAIMANVKTEYAHSAINGVNRPEGTTFSDHMESFWTAETLKYFYLLYSEPEVVSLDEWVLNTEAHPFKRSD